VTDPKRATLYSARSRAITAYGSTTASRERVRRIAGEMGSLREYPSSGPALSAEERKAFAERFRGVGPFLDDFLAERR